jgi:hypothetical protein
MKIIHLINNTYQVVSEDESSVHFQGSKEDCMRYFYCRVEQIIRWNIKSNYLKTLKKIKIN